MNYREVKKPSKATHVAYAIGSRYENPIFIEPYELPTEEEIDKLWERFSFKMETVDDDGEFTGTDVRLMTKPEFDLAITNLLKGGQ